jgi:hypothetical protein
MLVQAGWVGGSVGMMMVAAVGTALGVPVAIDGVQELRKNKVMNKRYKNDFCIVP